MNFFKRRERGILYASGGCFGVGVLLWLVLPDDTLGCLSCMWGVFFLVCWVMAVEKQAG